MTDITTTATVTTCAVVGVGIVLTTKTTPNAKTLVGGAVLLVSLSALDNVAPTVAEGLSLLILTTALLKYFPPVMDSLGLLHGTGNPVDPKNAPNPITGALARGGAAIVPAIAPAPSRLIPLSTPPAAPPKVVTV